MASRRTVLPRRVVLQAAGIATVVVSAGCATPLAESGEETTESSGTDGVDDEMLVAVADEGGEVQALTVDHVATVGDVQQRRQGDGYYLPIVLTDEGVDSLTEALRTAGALEDPDSAEIRFYLDGELRQSLHLAPGLAAAIRHGEFEGEFLLRVESRDEAESFREELAAETTGASA